MSTRARAPGSRARVLLAGLGATATLIAIVAGLPAVLYRYGGSPLPRHLASWHHLIAVLTSPDNGSLLLAIIRDFSWLAWLLFTACVLAELLAAARGRRAPYLRLGGMQSAAARLVALAALTFSTPGAVTLSASMTALSVHSQDMSPEVLTTAAAQPVILHSSQAGTLDAIAATRLITVRSGECLWSIAQRYLGAGDQYPEIVSLNFGREMGGGQVFTNPALIEPGWQLILPANSTNGQAQLGSGGSQHLGHRTRDPHYRRRHPAAQHGAADESGIPYGGNGASHAAAGPSARASSGQDQFSGQASRVGSGVSDQSDDSASYLASGSIGPAVGDQLQQAVVFAAGALAGSVLTCLTRLRRRQRLERRRGRRIALPTDRGVLTSEQRLRAAATGAPGRQEMAGDAEARRYAATPSGLGGYDDLPAPGYGDLPPHGAPGGQPRTLQDALSFLEGGLLRTGQPLPEIVGLHMTPAVMEVLLSAPASDSPPEPYVITPGRQGTCWQLDLTADLGLAVPDPSAPGAGRVGPGSGRDCHLLPGLLTAGATTDGYLLLDLEALQVTGCDGPGGLIDRFITTAATELATGQWSDSYELILVGCGELEVLGRAEHCASVDEALTLIESRCATVSRRLAGQPVSDVRELRLAAPDDEDWVLTILLSRIEPSPSQLARLLDLAEGGPGGIAVLVAGDPEAPDGRMAPAVLQLAPDPEQPEGIVANVIPLQVTVWPSALSAADYEAITTLFATASNLADVGKDDEPYAMYGAPPWIPQAAAMQVPPGQADPAAGFGAEAQRPDPQTPDLWLPGAQLRDGQLPDARLPDAQLEVPPPYRQASAPDGPVSSQRTPPRHAAAQRLQVKILGPFIISGAVEPLQPKQAELVLALALAAPGGLSNSALCAILGSDPDHPKPGDAVRQIITRTRRRLGHARDGQEYIIHAGNGHYVLHPDTALDLSEFRDLVATGRTDDLRMAVSLIRGQPFSGSYFWWIDIPLLETVRAELIDAAETLAESELANGYARAAARAARTGLLADSSAEQLWRIVLRAEHAAGNQAGVAEAWRRCLDAIEDIAPGGEPHPDTDALYRRLTTSARERAPAGG